MKVITLSLENFVKIQIFAFYFQRVFTIPERTHGPGPVFLTWQRGNANYLVTTGYDHSLILHDRHGDNVDSISLPG